MQEFFPKLLHYSVCAPNIACVLVYTLPYQAETVNN